MRNTYGGRHSYLLSTDQTGNASTAKHFYASPFFPVDGHYTMRLPEPGDTLTVTVTLHREPDRPFSAVMTGHRSAGRASLWAALRTPLATRAVMFGIRRHGTALYFKGLRPFPRPPGAQPTSSGSSAEEQFDGGAVRLASREAAI